MKQRVSPLILLLVCLGHYNKNTLDWVAYKQQTFISLSSGGLKLKIKVLADPVW